MRRNRLQAVACPLGISVAFLILVRVAAKSTGPAAKETRFLSQVPRGHAAACLRRAYKEPHDAQFEKGVPIFSEGVLVQPVWWDRKRAATVHCVEPVPTGVLCAIQPYDQQVARSQQILHPSRYHRIARAWRRGRYLADVPPWTSGICTTDASFRVGDPLLMQLRPTERKSMHEVPPLYVQATFTNKVHLPPHQSPLSTSCSH